jgi:hypothetical protein
MWCFAIGEILRQGTGFTFQLRVSQNERSLERNRQETRTADLVRRVARGKTMRVMAFSVDHIVPWGRSLDEYERMFA